MNERATYVRYRCVRALEALEEAQLLYDAGHFDACINRLYYACFYAVNALLLTKNLSAVKHSGVIRLFSEHVVRPGIVTEEDGKFYHRLFQFRQKSDYEDTFRVPPAHVSAVLPVAQAFVARLNSLTDVALIDMDS